MYQRIVISLLASAVLLSAGYVSAADVNPRGQRDSILLVAARHMMDPNFARTVVLVMFPTDTGPSGVILNRPSRITLRDVWPDNAQRQDRTDRLYIGGPVEPDGLLFLFRMTPPPERAWWAIDDIYFSGDGELLETLLETNGPDAGQRFFAGYAGWAPGQLENEIARGDWHVLAADPNVIYDKELGTLWQRMYQRATLPRAHGLPLQGSLAYHRRGANR
ncbi:MAG: YqgE/AlgH family protein [Betaproteobacteria bacterium]|nr:MAG: YqgE/AlgH family protein [Betaproteobacteria bacterium]